MERYKSKKRAATRLARMSAALALGGSLLLQAQQPAPTPVPGPTAGSGTDTSKSPATSVQAPAAAKKPEVPMTPAQARELFRSVDTILKFASDDTGLPIHRSVKRRLTTRVAVEAFLVEKMREDKDTARVERSEIVLKKFGLLERDFSLRPFLLSLLKEQIAGYYDSKTKTVNLLDWINPEEQKPVLAHELTHALQDQHVDLEKWGDQSIEGTPHDVADDNRHLLRDETDTAREAVLEGQAMVTYMDWSLAPSAQSLRTTPDLPAEEEDNTPDPDSPVLSRAPLVLKESLLFPYKDGLRFEQILLKDHGPGAAFSAVLDRPPSTSYEIMHPREYEQHVRPVLLTLPDVHPLLDGYKPYDLGVMGELDVRMLGQLFGGAGPAADLAKAWDGGIYYAAQSQQAVAAGQAGSTSSIGLLYLSQWTTPEAAASFARLYAASLGRKYRQVKAVSTPAGVDAQIEFGPAVSPSPAAADNAAAAKQAARTPDRAQFETEEGPVLISRVDRRVFISEGFPGQLAAALEQRVAGAPETRLASSFQPGSEVALTGKGSARTPAAAPATPAPADLTAPLVRFFGNIGMMKAGLGSAHRN